MRGWSLQVTKSGETTAAALYRAVTLSSAISDGSGKARKFSGGISTSAGRLSAVVGPGRGFAGIEDLID
jgi:hypothetical protein